MSKTNKNVMLTIQERALYPYMPNQKVKFNLNGTKGTGVICGMATQYLAMPLIGTVWIVRLDQPLEEYSYECIAIGAIHVQPLEGL